MASPKETFMAMLQAKKNAGASGSKKSGGVGKEAKAEGESVAVEGKEQAALKPKAKGKMPFPPKKAKC